MRGVLSPQKPATLGGCQNNKRCQGLPVEHDDIGHDADLDIMEARDDLDLMTQTVTRRETKES